MNNIQKINDIKYLIAENYSDKEPLNESQKASKQCFFNYCDDIRKELKEKEKLEKALKIITTRYVDLQCLFCSGYKEYNFHRDKKFHVSQEEFDLLKEVSGNGKEKN